MNEKNEIIALRNLAKKLAGLLAESIKYNEYCDSCPNEVSKMCADDDGLICEKPDFADKILIACGGGITK